MCTLINDFKQAITMTMESMPNGMVYLFAGVFISLLLQLFTSYQAEILISRREKRHQHLLAKNSLLSLINYIDALLERNGNGRSEYQIRSTYLDVLSTLPHVTKAEYGAVVKEVDKFFWNTFKQINDRNALLDDDYAKGKDNGIQKLKDSVTKT